MENALNLSLVEGRLVRDPEFINTKGGYHLCKFDIAVNFSKKVDNKYVNEATFLTVNTWNKIASACAQYLKKGSKVRIRGKIKDSTWTTEAGEKRKKLFIEAASVEFLNSPKKEENKVAAA